MTDINMAQVLKIEDDLDKVFKFFKKHCDTYFNTECCGFLGIKNNQFIGEITANRSPNPNLFFYIDPMDFIKFSTENELIAIFHSHTNTDAVFSDWDKEASEAACVPYLVYSVQQNKFAFYIPENHEIDVNILDKVKGLL